MRAALERFWVWIGAALLALQVSVLLAMGRPAFCKCGVKVWEGDIHKSSAQVVDWYTPSHIIHGMLFYGFGWLLAKRIDVLKPWQNRLLLAMVIEIAWEIFENTPWTIHRYRTKTASADYVGDTVLNSFCDTWFMLLGFWLVLKLPARWVFTIVVVFELVALWQVRDNLTLQVLTFLWPDPAIVSWQSHAENAI